jgi:pimeloyl-ACP methyl ester carboxylesterase
LPLQDHAAHFQVGGVTLDADISVPDAATGLAVFVHGSGSSRQSPRNQSVAATLRSLGLGTVLMDLLTPAEERADQFSGHLRFNIPFLAQRVGGVVDHLRRDTPLPIGLFGASTGAAAALVVAAARPREIAAVVSRGGRPDLAGASLSRVAAPTLLIVGGADHEVRALNRRAMAAIPAEVRLEIIPGASHLFQEPGALDAVAHLAADWLTSHLGDRGDSNETS